MAELEDCTLDELREMARSLDISGYTRLKKHDLIILLLRANAEKQGYIFGGGILEIVQDGIGFLRSDHLLPGPEDVYVSQSQIRRFGLRTGDLVVGQVRPPKDTEKYYGLLKVEAVNGLDPEEAKRRPVFEKQTPIFPDEQIHLETKPNLLATRMIDLLAPIGRGQRGLIVSPPKAGKTTILKRIANGMSSNYENLHLMVVLIGERPEEVTDMDRSVEAEVISSTFDEPVQNHVRVAEMALERAKRLTESSRDVVILLDSITRLTRAYNLTVPPSGRTLSGGIDPAARESVYAALKGMPVVAGVALQHAMLENFETFVAENMNNTMAINLLFAMVIAFGVIYNTARISLSERSRELASMRVMGFTRAEIGVVLFGELAILTAAAIPVGLGLGYSMLAGMLAAYETELFRMPLVTEPATFAWASAAVVGAMGLSAAVVRHKLNRLDLVEVLKTRE